MTTPQDARMLCFGDSILTGTTTPRLDFLLNIRKSPALEGVPLRVVFYDLDIFTSGPLFGAEHRTLDSFTSPSSVPLSTLEVPDCGSPRFPKLAKGSGVLLVMEGILRKMRLKKADRVGWAFVVQDKQENAVANVGSVVLVTPNEVGQSTPIANLVWRADDLVALGPRRTVLVRVVMGDDAAGLASGSVFASNLCKDHVWTDAKGVPVPIHVGRAPTPTTTALGGPAPAPSPSPPPPTSRTLSPDLTGYWEATFDDHAVPLTMFIHQAGHAIVGWFQPPPSNVQQVDLPQLPPGFPDHAGTFVGERDASPGPWGIMWGNSTSKFVNDSDPDDSPDGLRENNFGEIQLVPGQASNAYVQQLDFKLTVPGGGSQVSFRMTRRNARLTRWPNSLVSKVVALNQGPVAASVQDQLTRPNSPVPTSFWDHAGTILSEENPILVDAIKRWLSASITAEREVALAIVVGEIQRAVGVLTPAQLAESSATIRHILYANGLTVPPDDRRSLIDYLRQMVAKEQDDGIHVDPVFQKIGILGPDRFAYILQFLSLGVDAAVGLGGGVAAFKVTIEKAAIDPKNPENLIGVSDPDWKDSKDRVFIGTFFNIGAGLGVSGTTWAAKGGGGLPEKFVLRSFQDLELKSFEGAAFTLTAIKGPSFTFADAGVSFFSSAYFHLSMLDGSVVDGVSESGFKWGLSQYGLEQVKEFLKDPKKAAKKFLFPTKVETTVFKISEGTGILGTPESLHRIILPEKKLRQDFTKVGTPRCEAHTYFDVDSALISREMRSSLERGMAIFRKLWTEADAQATVEAYASPEDTTKHNQILTDARAAAVKQATVDAFGPDLCVKSLLDVGYGEGPATDPDIGGLIDPENAQPGDAAKIQKQKQEAWPMWRRVDLWAVGWLVMRLKPV